jgi:hypothetical protein
VLLISLVSAPTVMVVATAAERQLGSSVAGWIAALPTTLPIAILAVGVELGDRAGAALALSAAAHVGAQVAFAVSFAAVMRRRGAVVGLTAGAASFGCLSMLVGLIPAPAAAAAAFPALFVGPKLRTDSHVPAGGVGPRRHRDTALASAVAVVVVGAVLITARLVGPAAAGAIGAFPALSAALALVVVRTSGTGAGARALRGMIRGLPCYLAFCLVVATAAPIVGTLVAVPLAFGACLATCGLTWRSVRGPTTVPL